MSPKAAVPPRPTPRGAAPLLAALSLTTATLAGCSGPSSGSTSTSTSPSAASTATSTLPATTTAAAAVTTAADREKWLVVTSPAAPLLRKMEPHAAPFEVVHAGEMVEVLREIGPYSWSAKLEGKDAQREGVIVELMYTGDGVHRYGFKSDLGAEASVPPTSRLCDDLSAKGPFDRARCPALLRRARTGDGALLVYAACSSGTCPVAIVKDDKMSAIGVENLTSGWFFSGKKRAVLLVATRWVKDNGQQSGGSLVPILVENGALSRGEEIPVDAIDARDPKKSLARLVHATVTPEGISLEGEESTKSADGKTLSTKPIHDKRPLPTLD